MNPRKTARRTNMIAHVLPFARHTHASDIVRAWDCGLIPQREMTFYPGPRFFQVVSDGPDGPRWDGSRCSPHFGRTSTRPRLVRRCGLVGGSLG